MVAQECRRNLWGDTFFIGHEDTKTLRKDGKRLLGKRKGGVRRVEKYFVIRMTLANETSDPISRTVIGLAIEVHRHLGPGLLESNYEDGLCWEFNNAGLPFNQQVVIPVIYKGTPLRSCHRPDLIVSACLIIEVKAVDKLAPIHSAQLLTYLKHSGLRVGLLFNFNSPVLKDGMKRIVL